MDKMRRAKDETAHEFNKVAFQRRPFAYHFAISEQDFGAGRTRSSNALSARYATTYRPLLCGCARPTLRDATTN